MTVGELNAQYFNWMVDKIYDRAHCKRKTYIKLLHFLHDSAFTYIIDMDENREIEGLDLRVTFGDEHGYSRAFMDANMTQPCSILEMMVALTVHCEDHIMSDPEIGDRTGIWFWGMIDNLGLSPYDDLNFNEHLVENIVFRFLNRRYAPNGEGGLFTVRNCSKDLRVVEIWYQMCWYLDQLVK